MVGVEFYCSYIKYVHVMSFLLSLLFLLYCLIYALGSIPESDGDKLYNTCTVFNPSGEMLGKYRKVRPRS